MTTMSTSNIIRDKAIMEKKERKEMSLEMNEENPNSDGGQENWSKES